MSASESFNWKAPVRIRSADGLPEAAHVFDADSVLAIRSALAAKRPLLLRGEPGVGKTQLAAAAARVLGRPLVSFVVDARTEASDLLWSFDSVRRLAEAQLCGALKLSDDGIEERLSVERFLAPGPLWWGFDWDSADKQAERSGARRLDVEKGCDPARGCVVLIDEIDKADTDVPNGLLEALGAGRFKPEAGETVSVANHSPLVVVTTNEERALPDAFVRRCLVHRLELPGDGLKEFLVERARVHFQRMDEHDTEFIGEPLDDDLLGTAADMLIDDRGKATAPLPGLAEYLDLLRAVRELDGCDLTELGVKSREELLNTVAQFTIQKHAGSRR